MNTVIDAAGRVAELLASRGETIAIAESSAGGRISAALLAVPGASAYFRGGAVAYTADAKKRFLNLDDEALSRHRAATPEHALVLARAARELLGTTWGIGETGAAGPTGNRYGDPAGHTCVAVSGATDQSLVVSTESDKRDENMDAFALAALELLTEVLSKSDR
jgi:nicotinamide-nucleotide amidase